MGWAAVWGALLAAGCATPGAPGLEPIEGSPFIIRLVKWAGWREGLTGYDRSLPGYHLTGGIGSIRIQPQPGTTPRRLVLAIRTSPGMPPMLESFTLTAPVAFVQSGMRPEPEEQIIRIRGGAMSGKYEPTGRGTYFTFKAVGDEVHVTFQKAAMALLKDECGVAWVDYWR